MRILIWSPNYAPELIGIPPLVTDVAEWLVSRGHDVSVVTAMPNYPQRQIYTGYGGLVRTRRENAVEVRRSWLRVRPGESFIDKALYEASFAAFSAPGIVTRLRRADAVVCLVPTLLTSATAAVLSHIASTRLVLWIQDLVLRAAHAVNDLSAKQARLLSAARLVESLAVRRAARVVTCSTGFVPYLLELGADPRRVSTIPNWIDTDRVRPSSPPPQNVHLTLLYTGNVGYTQGFETLTDAVRTVGDVELRIVGGGNAQTQVESLMRGLGTVEPSVPAHEYGALLGSADVLVVVQRGLAANANFPSKIASYLAAGRPIVASIGLHTPAAEMLRDSGGALVVEPERPDLLADAIVRLRDDPWLRRKLGERGRRYAEANLAKDIVLERLERAFLWD